ncbi:xylulose kinase [Xylanimonas oleitrophica]|uniref:Xylulose kinase n=1 Tax=Xylanimonas oleitrophica TaxID=2607479 RepID=A0A2W5WZV3_9MICO|nr:FGGY family carbohydrate kinase [Xylanimonas oleitrophica]PZR53475.1 xylulose kinase [Xylanimonas oleitrophica]
MTAPGVPGPAHGARAGSGTSWVVAVDCSTTAAKAVVVDTAGQVVAAASQPLTTQNPQPGFHEQDADAWFEATVAAVHAAVEDLAPAERSRVGALAITHQRESFVLLDGEGKPLRPAVLWVDSRAHEQIATLGARPLSGGRSVHDVSGKPPDTTPAVYKIAWLAEHEPQVVHAAAHVADVQAYLALRLTGHLATSHASADTLGLFDLARLDWSPELVEAVGLRPEQLPGLVAGGEVIGELLPDVASDLGLPGPVPLVAGIGDGQSAGLALGVEEPGVAYLNLGTSMVCGVSSDVYITSPAFRTLAGVRPGTYVLETVLNAAAYVASWTARFAGSDVTTMEAEAAQVPPGAEGLLALPYWNAAQTPHWDALARGAVVGWHGRHTPAHLYRAVLEGVALELRLQLEALEKATGSPVREIRAVGGGARSALWAQIVADVTGRTVRVCSDGEVSAAGAAIQAHEHLAGSGDAPGRPGDAPAGARDAWPFVATGHDVVPEPAATARYGAVFEAYRGLYPALKETFARLATAG